MNDFFEKLNKAKQEVIFEADRKHQVRNNIMRFMNANPITQVSKVSGYARIAAYFRLHRVVLASSVCGLVLIITSGTAYAAQGSLPGDILYPVKVHINEGVKAAALSFNPEAAANFEVTRAENRLEEADKLAAEGKLTPAAKTEVAQNFSAHIEQAQTKMQELADKGESDAVAPISARLEASLQVNSAVLGALKDKDSETNTPEALQSDVDAALVKIRNRKNSGSKRESEQLKPSEQDAAKTIEDAAKTIDQVNSFITQKEKSKKGDTSVIAGKEQLDQAKAALDSARAQFKSANFQASDGFSQAAAEAALQAKALTNVEVNVPLNMKIDHSSNTNTQQSGQRSSQDDKSKEGGNRQSKDRGSGDDSDNHNSLRLKINF